MALRNFFGTTNLISASGYNVDTTGTAIMVVSSYYVVGGTDGYQLRTARIYLSSGPSYVGAHMYVFELDPLTIVRHTAIDTLTSGWNNVDLATPYNISEYPGGKYFAIAFWLPNGGFIAKQDVILNGNGLRAIGDTNIAIAEPGDFLATPSLGLPDNNCYATGTLTDPTDFSGLTFIAPPNSGGFHYGLDVSIADPSEPPIAGPTNVPPELISGASLSPSTGVHVADSVTVLGGSWSNSPNNYSFQKQRNSGSGFANSGSPILDASGTLHYTVLDDDKFHPTRFSVTAINDYGSSIPSSTNSFTPADVFAGPEIADELAIGSGGHWVTLNVGHGLRVVHECGVRPEDFGVLGGSDDAETLELCIFGAVFAAMNNGSYYTEIFLDPSRTYNLTRNPTAGGTINGLDKLGYSQVGVPAIVPEDSQHVVVKINGFGEASCNHWAQPVAQKSGAMLKSTVRAVGNSGTYGAPSVIGAPTVQIGTNPLAPNYSNIMVVLDGVTVQMPANPGMIAVDMRGAAQFIMRRSLVNVTATAADLTATPPADANGIGVYFPSPGNNAVLDCPELTVQGYYYGAALAEHFTAMRLLILHCNRALYVAQHRDNSTSHSYSIQYACFEAIQTVAEFDPNASSPYAFSIAELDLELIGSSQQHFMDANSRAYGEIGWNDYQSVTPRITTGVKNLRIIDRKTPRGSSALTLSASGAAGSIMWRDRRIHIGGGTLTAVTVDGVTLPDVPRSFDVPSGRPWTVTYTGTPTAAQVAF
jgi:hypothetical protein